MIYVGNRAIGPGRPAFIVAELSANHNGDLATALATIRAARDAGADAIKIQTYTADTITVNADNPLFTISGGTPWDGKTLHQLYRQASTPWEWHVRLQEEARYCGLLFFSSPFDRSAVDFLEQLSVPAYKIASFEITDIPLIEYVASRKKPVILSTGIAELNDITAALDACRRAGNEDIALLKCTSAYPAPLKEMNLATIPDYAQRFKVVTGVSDHTLTTVVPVAAVALGASIIEKHIILARALGGPDAAFSLEPAEFKKMVDEIRSAEAACGSVSYELSAGARKNRFFARSLFVVQDMSAGEVVTEQNVRSIRPGSGMHPRFYPTVLGRKVVRAVRRGTPLTQDLLEK